MRSLSQLNTRGQTSLEYTDLRDAQVIFDRSAAVDQNQNITNRIFSAQPGIEIIEIVQPDVVNVYYQINVSSVSGATVAWDSLPGTISVTNPSTGVYRASNIDSAADWTAVRAPTITLPLGYGEDFEYTATVYYESGQSEQTTVSAKFVTTLASQFALTGKLTGTTKFEGAISAVFSVALKAEATQAASLVVSSANLTANGRYNIGKLRSAITATASITARGRYNTGKLAANITSTAAMSVQAIALKVGNIAATATVTQTVLNTDYFDVTVLTDDVSNTNSYFGTQLSINADATVIGVGNDPDTSPNYSYIFSRSGNTWSQDTRISNDGAAISVIGSSLYGDDANVFIGEQYGSEVFVYKKVTGTWTLDQTFTPADTNYSWGRIIHSPAGNGGFFGHATLIFAPDTQDAYVQYYKDDSPFTGWYQTKLPRSDYLVYGQNSASATISSAGVNDDISIPVDNGSYVKILYYNRNYDNFNLKGSPDIETGFVGDRQEVTTSVWRDAADVRYLAVGYVRNNASNPAAGYVKIYISSDAGDTWTLQTTLTAQNPAVNDRFGQALSFNSSSELVIGSPGEGSVYIYKRSGTTWTAETVLRPDNATAAMKFGETVDIGTDCYVIGAPNGDLGGAGQVYVYRRVAT